MRRFIARVRMTTAGAAVLLSGALACASVGLPGAPVRAAEVSRRIAAQIHGERGDVLGGRHALEWRALDPPLTLLLDWHSFHLSLTRDDPIDAVAGDGAGGDRVDPDVVLRQLERETVRHPDLPGLRRTVADAIGKPAPARRGRDVHDHTPTRLDHLGHREPRAHVRAGETRVDRVEPLLGRVVLHRLGGTAVTSIVHQGVELAEALHGGRHEALHVGLDRGVAGDGDRSAPVGLHEPRRFLHQIPGARRANHRGALAGEHTTHHTPDTLARAGDEHDSSLELPHGPSSRGQRNAWMSSSAATICPPRVEDATTMRVRTPAASHASKPSRTSDALPKSVTSWSQRSDMSSGMRWDSPRAMTPRIATISSS